MEYTHFVSVAGLVCNDKVSCFNFTREPFEVVTEGKYTVGE